MPGRRTASTTVSREISDADLLSDAADLGLSSVAELYRRHRPHALAVARSVLHDESAAEDVVQEVFISLPRRAMTFDPSRGGALQWLLRGVRNRAIDAVRQDGRRRALSQAPSSTLETEWLGSADPVAVEYGREVGDRGPRCQARGPLRPAAAPRVPRGLVPFRHRRPDRAAARDGEEPHPRRAPADSGRPDRCRRDSETRGHPGCRAEGPRPERIVVISQDDAWTGAVRAAAGNVMVEVQPTSSDLHAGDVPAALFIDARASTTSASDMLASVDGRLHLRTRSGAATDRRGHRPPEAVRQGLTIQDVEPSRDGAAVTTLALEVLSAGGGARRARRRRLSCCASRSWTFWSATAWDGSSP